MCVYVGVCLSCALDRFVTPYGCWRTRQRVDHSSLHVSLQVLPVKVLGFESTCQRSTASDSTESSVFCHSNSFSVKGLQTRSRHYTICIHNISATYLTTTTLFKQGKIKKACCHVLTPNK